MESRDFGTRFFDLTDFNYMQPITDQDLLLNGMDNYDYYSGEYTIEPWTSGGFDYVLKDNRRIGVEVFVTGANPAPFGGAIKDIWDALRVNERNGPRIGNNNLQIIIDGDKVYFNNPFDIVYTPLSRMTWKDKSNILE